MKKITLLIGLLCAVFTAGAEEITHEIANSLRLTAEELMQVEGSKRIAIRCTQKLEKGRMIGCILASKITQSNNYNEWLATKLPAMNDKQKNEALMLQSYFINTSPKVYRYMNPTEDLYLSFYVSTKPGCGKRLLAEVITKARQKGFRNLYLWTDSSCNHSYYAHNGFTLVEEFKNGDWDAEDDSYLTYIYKKSF